MKKSIILLFVTLLLSGCMYSNFTYKVTNPEVLASAKNYSKASVGDLYWGGMAYGSTEGKAWAGLYQVTDKDYKFLCGFSTQLVAVSCDKKRTKEDLNKEFGARRHAFGFFGESRGGYAGCEFDNSKMYMIKDGKKVQLELIDFRNMEVLLYSKDSLTEKNMVVLPYTRKTSKGYPRRRYYIRFFRSPWIDDELENVELEVGGFYADGIKAPVLRFRMNYRDSIKWRCLDNEPKPSFFKRKWYDIKDFFQDPQKQSRP